MPLTWNNLRLRTKALIVVSLPVTALLAAVILINRVQLQQNEADAWITRATDAQDRVLQDHLKRTRESRVGLQIAITASAAAGLLGGILAILLFTRVVGRRVQELVGQGDELRLALENAQVLSWELEPASGRIRYQPDTSQPSQLTPETVGAWVSSVHPEDRIDVRQELDQFVGGCGPFQVEYRVALKGGETRWMAAKGRYQASGNGRPQRLVGVLADITERKNAESERSREALQRQTEILQMILDGMGDAVAVADETGKFILFSPTARQMFQGGQPPESGRLARAVCGKAIDDEELFWNPVDAVEGLWLRVIAQPLWAEDGKLQGGVVVLRDITAVKRAEEVLRLAQKANEDANQPEADPEPQPAESQQGTVLYIEDNLSSLRLMERILAHRPGVKMLSATQARTGLDLAKAHRPDWILLDPHLPDLPAEEVLRRLRGNPQTQQIPVTVISEDATQGQIDRLMAAGAHNHLTKPLDARKLLRLLQRTMRRGEAHSRQTS